MKPAHRTTILRVLAIVAVVAVSLAIVSLPEEQVQRLEAYGYPGLFLLSIISNATVLIPAPGWLIVISMGARFSPLGVALVAGSGAALGELSGYAAGFSGQAVVEDNKIYQRMVGWMERNGSLTVLLLAFFPNPFFDLTGMAAGALKMPLPRFLFWCWLGKIGKMLIFALTGAGLFQLPFFGAAQP